MKNGNGRIAPAAENHYSGSFFPKVLSRVFDDNFWGFDGQLTSTQVPVNICETDASFELEVIAPGLNKEDFKLRMDGELLQVSFEQQEDKREETQDGRYLRTEYRHQSFSRSFRLDDQVDTSRIGARYQDGVLYISLPKKEDAQRIKRDIEVQ
jgi:HSP20 family protein